MVSWYLDKGLDRLSAQLKNKFAGIVIGTIGDQSHQNRNSAHNPEADGSVDAIDPMIGKTFRHADAEALFHVLHDARDPRLKNVIWDGQIFSSETRPWVIREYTGSADPHTGHMHIEVNDKHENDGSPWRIASRALPYVRYSVNMPLYREGDDERQFDGYDLISRIQRVAGIEPADGIWGPATSRGLGFKEMTEVRYRQLFGESR
jgi:hypothetical protein